MKLLINLIVYTCFIGLVMLGLSYLFMGPQSGCAMASLIGGVLGSGLGRLWIMKQKQENAEEEALAARLAAK